MQERGPGDVEPGVDVTERRARIGMPPTGEIRIERAARTITFATPEPLRAEAIVHPGLGPAAAIVAWWAGRAAFHAAAVLVGDGVWGILADRGGGKSTTAALLTARGCRLFTDDMLIVDGTTAFAGPASVDLRADAAAALGGRPLGVIGARERWRKALPVPVSSAPLTGWVLLGWGPFELTEVGAADRIAALAAQTMLSLGGEHLLELADRPMLRFMRPASLADAGAVVDALLAAMRGA